MFKFFKEQLKLIFILPITKWQLINDNYELMDDAKRLINDNYYLMLRNEQLWSRNVQLELESKALIQKSTALHREIFKLKSIIKQLIEQR